MKGYLAVEQRKVTVRSYSEDIRESSSKALLRALGLNNQDLKKPRIAIIDTWNVIDPGQTHLTNLAESVKEGIVEAGGLAFNYNLTNLSDGAGDSPYILPSRDLMCNEIETIMDGCLLDGMVLIASRGKTVAGILQGAARMDLPTVVVTGGYPQDDEESVSSDSLLDTAETMCVLAEAMGMTMPGNTSLPAISTRLQILAREAGRRVMELWREGITARKIMTEAAVTNAIKVCMAIGAPVNTMLHLPAIAAEAGLEMDCWAVYDQASREIPVLDDLCAQGQDVMFRFAQAGGLRALMTELKEHLDLTCTGVSGRTLAQELEGCAKKDSAVIRTLAEPVRANDICVLRGNIAPEGIVTKQAAFDNSLQQFRGPAKVFYSDKEAVAALKNGEIAAGDAVVLIMVGPKGGPGMPACCAFEEVLAASNLKDRICVLTDGRFTGKAPFAAAGFCSPEAALGGPICAVRDGDMICCDVAARAVNVELSDAQIAERAAAFDRKPEIQEGFLGMYQKNVTSWKTGGLLKPTGGHK